MIGTDSWTTANDLGNDGVASTYDEGEGDGIPTPGEANVTAVSVGPASAGVSLIAWEQDTAYAGVKRVVATAFTSEAESTVEVFASCGTPPTLPGVGAVYIEPDVVLDLKGNKFFIDGHDTNTDGTDGPGPDTYGIATEENSTTPGDNASDIVDQIASGEYDQVIGIGADPSVGETTTNVDMDALFESLKALKDQTVASGTHSNITWGTDGSPTVTYCDGDLHLSGQGEGVGILLVDGNATFSGQMNFDGIVMVCGDVSQTCGGSGVHIYGTLMVSKSISVVDDPELKVAGNADIIYSSQAIANAQASLGSSTEYTVLFWNYMN